MALSLLSKPRRLRLESQPLDPSNMKTDPVASERLCSMLAGGGRLLSSRNLWCRCAWQMIREPLKSVPGLFCTTRRRVLPARTQGLDTLCSPHPSSVFDFLLLYLTGRVVLDNRHGLPNKFESFQAAQLVGTCAITLNAKIKIISRGRLRGRQP